MKNTDNKCNKPYKEFPYDKNALSVMYSMQREFQISIAKKYNKISPDNTNELVPRFIEEGIYYWGCATVEFFEFIDQFKKYTSTKKKDNSSMISDQLLVIWHEYIDIWNLIMSVFIFVRIETLPFSFDSMYDDISNSVSKSLNKKLYGSFDMIHINAFWGAISEDIGKLFSILPYKKWKKHGDVSLTSDELSEMFYIIGLVVSSFICIGKILGINKEIFFNLYMSKNKRNNI